MEWKPVQKEMRGVSGDFTEWVVSFGEALQCSSVHSIYRQGNEAQGRPVIFQDDITQGWQVSPLIVFLDHYAGPIEVPIP